MKIDFTKLKNEIEASNVLKMYYEYSLILEYISNMLELNQYNKKSSILREAITFRKEIYELCSNLHMLLNENASKEDLLEIVNKLEEEIGEIGEF